MSIIQGSLTINKLCVFVKSYSRVLLKRIWDGTICAIWKEQREFRRGKKDARQRQMGWCILACMDLGKVSDMIVQIGMLPMVIIHEVEYKLLKAVSWFHAVDGKTYMKE